LIMNLRNCNSRGHGHTYKNIYDIYDISNSMVNMDEFIETP